jgi:hypothetical protein
MEFAGHNFISRRCQVLTFNSGDIVSARRPAANIGVVVFLEIGH